MPKLSYQFVPSLNKFAIFRSEPLDPKNPDEHQFELFVNTEEEAIKLGAAKL